MWVSVLSATIITTLHCQSFYNSQHTPSLNLVGEVSPPSRSLSRSQPPTPTEQLIYKHRLCEPTCWSITDGGLAIAILLLPKALDLESFSLPLLPFSAPFLSPLQPYDHHLSLRAKQNRTPVQTRRIVNRSWCRLWVFPMFLLLCKDSKC